MNSDIRNNPEELAACVYEGRGGNKDVNEEMRIVWVWLTGYKEEKFPMQKEPQARDFN